MERTSQVAPGVDVDAYVSALNALNVEGYTDQAVAEAVQSRDNGESAIVQCWRHRGCEGLMGLCGPMEDECPHNRKDCYRPCPEDCQYTSCSRPWHDLCTDFNLILDVTVDRGDAVKKACYTCSYFLRNAPRIGEGDVERIVPDAATKDSDSAVTIHLF